MVSAIHDWHRSEWDADYDFGGANMVMGCSLWGKSYVDNFLAYCAPSLRANRLDGWAVVLFVDGPTERLLDGLELGGARVCLRRLPEAIMDVLHAEPMRKYPLLAAVHNLLIHQAGKANAGFHMLVADAVYSQRYFQNLERLSLRHDAIVHTGFAIVADTGLVALDPYRREDDDGQRLYISPESLGRIGRQYLNPQWASWSMDDIAADFKEMPDSYSHYIHWRGRDHFRIHCPHQSAVWISPERCRKVEQPLGGTVDSELPRYLAGSFYQPTLDDEMTYIVIAEEGVPAPRVPFEKFRHDFWRFIGDNRDFLPVFFRPCVVPARLDPNAPSNEELDSRMDRMMAKLEEGRPT